LIEVSLHSILFVNLFSFLAGSSTYFYTSNGTFAMHISTPFALITLLASVHGSAFPQEQIPQGAPPSVAIAQAAKPSVPVAAGSSKPEAGSSKSQAAAPSSPAPAAATSNAAEVAPSNPINAANDLVTAKDLMGLSNALDPAQILKDLGAAAGELVDQATDAAGAKDPKKGGKGGEDPKKGGRGGEDPKKGGKGAGGGNGNDGKCPPVWGQISKDLSRMFISGGQCNDDARASIRAVFHDCFPEGGCDGSLALPAEISRRENAIMTPTVTKLANLAQKRGVSTADMLAFAGCKCSRLSMYSCFPY
jgi:hypothetical protein